jgi:hypothetical protein
VEDWDREEPEQAGLLHVELIEPRAHSGSLRLAAGAQQSARGGLTFGWHDSATAHQSSGQAPTPNFNIWLTLSTVL